MKREHILGVAQTIWQQIRATANFFVIGSWGIKSKYANKYNGMAALGLKVNGMKHKGMVWVAYNEGADTYEVFLENADRSVKTHVDDVYCDQLASMLDYLIER